MDSSDLRELLSLVRTGRERVDSLLTSHHEIHEERGCARALLLFSFVLVLEPIISRDWARIILPVALLIAVGQHYVRLSAASGERQGLDREAAGSAYHACVEAEQILLSMAKQSARR